MVWKINVVFIQYFYFWGFFHFFWLFEVVSSVVFVVIRNPFILLKREMKREMKRDSFLLSFPC